MSGTSLDGIDVAALQTNGLEIQNFGPFQSFPYKEEFKQRLKDILGTSMPSQDVKDIEAELTTLHAQAVETFFDHFPLYKEKVDIIGFHGQSILHAPEIRKTWQIGDGQSLASRLRKKVVNSFRSHDVSLGGQGAPLVPLFHQAISHKLDKPVAFLNVGGVANVTWLGPGADEILAFDTGPGNAYIDDFVYKRTGQRWDKDGRFAQEGWHLGKISFSLLQAWLELPYFSLQPPKSLDRNSFKLEGLDALSLEEGAALLSWFTAHCVRLGLKYIPKPPKAWYVCGGGRYNATLMKMLKHLLETEDRAVMPIEALGWDGDAVEAQAFAYLAVRAYYKMPLSLPKTTGVPAPARGGRLYLP